MLPGLLLHLVKLSKTIDPLGQIRNFRETYQLIDHQVTMAFRPCNKSQKVFTENNNVARVAEVRTQKWIGNRPMAKLPKLPAQLPLDDP